MLEEFYTMAEVVNYIADEIGANGKAQDARTEYDVLAIANSVTRFSNAGQVFYIAVSEHLFWTMVQMHAR